ncbi:hypothetical protein [Streptomyces sp. MZ04]|uniref:hypothetical protein n=1 Tax=Streptomyces sp. MZ04 TaxID=2559236 RepID=UPI00107EA7B1|nr:hypothetical protein [Streptomyces sp. MZ04]TGA99100.1 hypothetical protein E2651_29855 [Streptomyces sp. MZ04]
MDVWIYVAPDRHNSLELVRAESVLHIEQSERTHGVRVDRQALDSSLVVAHAVGVIDEPPLPEHFALGLVQALEQARSEAEQEGRDRAVTARLTPGRLWEWGIFRLDELPLSWRTRS